jgi:uncharacterized protein YktA (UPF0223 family)
MKSSKKSGIKSYILTSLITAVLSYVKKKENRDKIKEKFNKGKTILKSRIEQKKIKKNDEQTIGSDPITTNDDYNLSENNMIDEGAQTTVDYFNKEQEKK